MGLSYQAMIEASHDDNASFVYRPRKPDEYVRGERFHRSVPLDRFAAAEAAPFSGELGALVHRGDGCDRNGSSQNHPRLLWLSPGIVRVSISRRGRTGNR